MSEPKPWVHRMAGKIHTVETLYTDITIYYRKSGRLVTEVCTGDRYAHIGPGLIFMDENYRGSYLDDWHGGPTGSLTDIVRWLENANYLEYGSTLWMRGD